MDNQAIEKAIRDLIYPIIFTTWAYPFFLFFFFQGIHEVPGVRLPLQTSYASPPHAVFMYSTSSEGVTLQLRDTDDMDDKTGLASVLARLQQEDATLSISYQDTEMLTEGSIDVLLGTGSLHTTGKFLKIF